MRNILTALLIALILSMMGILSSCRCGAPDSSILFEKGVRRGRSLHLGRKAERDWKAERLYNKAAASMDKTAGIFCKESYNEPTNKIGWYNPNSYELLIEVIQKYPDSESAINAQLRLAYLLSETKFTDEDYKWSFELLKQIENNYPDKWQGLFAGCIIRIRRIDLHANSKEEIRKQIRELEAYKNKYIVFVKMDKEIDIPNYRDWSDNNSMQAMTDYYSSLSYYYYYIGDYDVAKDYAKKTLRIKPNDKFTIDILRDIREGNKCTYDMIH